MNKLIRFAFCVSCFAVLAVAVPGAAHGATIMINDGAYHEIDDATYDDDDLYVRNDDCPPGWPSGNPDDPCPSPGGATEVALVDGGDAWILRVFDSSTFTMSGGNVVGPFGSAPIP